jgi:hypothetical protein
VIEKYLCSMCGRGAIKKFKNGKYCCSDNVSQCPSVKEKIIKYAVDNSNENNIKRRRNDILYKMKNGDEITLQSSYEFIVAIELDKNNIRWFRPSYFYYLDKDGVKRKYYPDFYLIDHDIYLDPKNEYLVKKDLYKVKSAMKCNNIKIIMLLENELEWNKIYELIENKDNLNYDNQDIKIDKIEVYSVSKDERLERIQKSKNNEKSDKLKKERELKRDEKRKIRDLLKSQKHCGIKNSQYGKIWITNGIENKKWKDNEELPENFYKGRTYTGW